MENEAFKNLTKEFSMKYKKKEKIFKILFEQIIKTGYSIEEGKKLIEEFLDKK